MRNREKEIFGGYLGKNGIGIWIAVFFLILGISMGAFTERMMQASQKNDLLEFVNTYFNIMHLDSIPNTQIFLGSLINNFKLLGIIFISGVVVIGFPIALAVLTFRGVAIGFAAAFFMEEMKIRGLLLSVFSILPQSIVFIPAFVIAAAVSIGFSFRILSARGNRTPNNTYGHNFISYLAIYIIITIFIIIGCFIESYIGPALIRLIISL